MSGKNHWAKVWLIGFGLMAAVACGSSDSPTMLTEGPPVQVVPNPTVPPVSPTSLPTTTPTSVPQPATPQPTTAPTGSPIPPQPTVTPTASPTGQPTGIPGVGAVLRVPGIAANAQVTITASPSGPVLAVSSGIVGDQVRFAASSVTIPFGGQIRVTPAIPNPPVLTIRGTTFNPSNDVFAGTTAYFNFGPLVVLN